MGFYPNQETQGRCLGQCSSPDKKAIYVCLVLIFHYLVSPFCSGVGGGSVLNTGSMVPGRSMASGLPGPSGPTAPEPVEEGSCTGSAPAPAQGICICTYSHSLLIGCITSILMPLDGYTSQADDKVIHEVMWLLLLCKSELLFGPESNS